MNEPVAFLVVAHAQHPLEDGLIPGSDFRARLDRAAKIYRGLPTTSSDKMIYVPGSRHRGDMRSLADAGMEYLINKGIDERVLRGEGWNREFRGERGVYCGADEADVAVRALSMLSERRGLLRRVVAVCALGQAARLGLHYEGFGVSGEELKIETVGSDALHEGVVERVLTAYTRFDPRWRGVLPELIRASRRPRTDSLGASDDIAA